MSVKHCRGRRPLTSSLVAGISDCARRHCRFDAGWGWLTARARVSVTWVVTIISDRRWQIGQTRNTDATDRCNRGGGSRFRNRVWNKCIGDDAKAAARQNPNCILKTQKIKYGEKRFSIWRMKLLHCVMWHDHDIDFARWLHPAMRHVALESWQWIHQVAAPCNVILGSGLICHEIHQNVRHIGILHLVSILTISPQSTWHSAPVCEILSKSDHLRQKKMTSCRFLRWRISAILDFKDPVMGSLKSRCATSYRSSIATIALNCLLFEKIALFAFWRQTDRETDRRTDGQHRCTKPLSLSRAAA